MQDAASASSPGALESLESLEQAVNTGKKHIC